MELSQLRYVVAVAETGNFTRAANRAGISQPSLSQQIINLEKELGHKLFHRLGRKAVLTEAGNVFLERAKRILFEIEDTTKELRDSPSLERTITVGAIPTIAPYLLPELISKCRKRFPNLQVNVREDFKPTLIRELREGDLDLAVVALPVVDPMIHVDVLWKEPLVLAVAKDHPLASKSKVTDADLAQEVFILLGSYSSLADQVRRFCGEHHFEPKIGARCAQVSTLKALTEIGAGISILPRGARTADDKDSLAFISLADSEPIREVAVIRHMQRYQSRGAEQFLSLLRERPDTIGSERTP
jgi:LysR family hydrogen peroxide-inducible transcriptional activator